MMDIAYEKLQEIIEDVQDDLAGIETEQDVRFRIINRVLVEVLGWEYQEIKTEKVNDQGYSDYLLINSGKSRAIVEAKRTNAELISTKNKKLQFLKLSGPGLKPAGRGIEQARKYCFEESVDFALLTNGITWLGFMGSRSDGKKVMDGKAIAFPDLASVQENFGKFWDLFSKEGVLSKLYRVHINEAEGFNLSPSEPLFAAIEEDRIKLANKTSLSRDLDEVFEHFFSTMSGDEDPEMIINCFVESKESKYADKTLSKIASEIINNLEAMESSTGELLTNEIRHAVETGKGERILIIGNKGAGKTTFIDRFFKHVLAKKLQKRCTVLRIDLSKSPDDSKAISSWMTNELHKVIDQDLYQNRAPEYEELKGIFRSEYDRWKGLHKHLYKKNWEDFQIKFSEHLQSIISNNSYSYCIHQLKDIVKNRKRLPCVIFDNADQFSLEFQQSVFQFANAIFEEAGLVFVIVPITDQTVWKLSKAGPLQSYPSRSFYLPVPSTKEVLEKRIEYVTKKIEEEKSNPKEYFTQKGMRLSIDNLEAFVACLEEVFLNHRYIARRIGCLTNYGIRYALELSHQLMASPHIGIDNLVSAFFAKQDLKIPNYKILLGLINGSYEFYKTNSYVMNLFTVDADNINSPLTKARILKLLQDQENSVQDPLEAYLTLGQVEEYFDPIGIPPHVIRKHLQELLVQRAIEPYNPTKENVEPGQKVCITHNGRMHLELAIYEPVYFTQMALVTPIRKKDVTDEINRFLKYGALNTESGNRIRSLFLSYCLEQDALFVKIPPNNKNYAGQLSLREELQFTKPEKNLSGRVRWFNKTQGYGFVEILDKNDDAYLSLTVVERCGYESIEPDSRIICDVMRTQEGFQIMSISDLKAPDRQTKKSETTYATVKFYDPKKGFGFLIPENGGKDIFLPKTTLATAGLNEIYGGQQVLVEYEMEIKGPIAKSIAI